MSIMLNRYTQWNTMPSTTSVLRFHPHAPPLALIEGRRPDEEEEAEDDEEELAEPFILVCCSTRN
jgi:hypothetical protein